MGMFEKWRSGKQKPVAEEQARKAAGEAADKKWQAAKLAAEGDHTPWNMQFPVTDATDSLLPNARVDDPYGSAQRRALERLESGLPVDDESLERLSPSRNSALNPNITGGERIARGGIREEPAPQSTSGLTPDMDAYIQTEMMRAAEHEATKDQDPKPTVEN